MYIEVIGSGIGTDLLSLALDRQGWEVVYFRLPDDDEKFFRPARLSSTSIRTLKSSFYEAKIPTPESLRNPLPMEAWALSEGGRLANPWTAIEKTSAWWVDLRRIRKDLAGLVHSGRFRVIRCNQSPLPKLDQAHLSVVNLNEDQLLHWPRAFLSRARKSPVYKSFEAQILLPQNHNLRKGEGLFEHFGGASIFHEALNRKESCLSLYSPLEFHISNALGGLIRSSTRLPLGLRALILSNPGLQSLKRQQRHGPSRFYAPSFIPLGAALGSLHPISGRNLDIELVQVASLVEQLGEHLTARRAKKKTGPLEFAEQWQKSQYKRMDDLLNRSKLWKKQILSQESSQTLMTIQSILPAFLREKFGSPF